jgi:DNA repair protein RadC
MAITDWPADERPREKLLKNGAYSLSDAELLAIFLRVGTPGKTALDLARELIVHYGNLKSLLAAKQHDFCAFPGMGPAKYVQLQASLEMSKRYFHDEMRENDAITNPEATKQFLLRALTNKKHEVFACLYLNNQHQILAFEELFQGTLDAASVYPREVLRHVIEKGAAAVIFCHNHPSGSTVASQADIQLTNRLTQALALIDVRVLDHMIVAGNQVVSFAEQGLLTTHR